MTSDNDEEWFADSLKHNEAWRAALKKERGINAEMIEAKIMEAWDHPNIPNEDAELTKISFQRSYLLFCNAVETGNANLHELSMTEGELAFARSDKLHTKLVLSPEVMRYRSTQAGRAKGGTALTKRNAATALQAEENRALVQGRYRQLMSEKNSDDRTAKARTIKQLLREFSHLSESAIRRALSTPGKQ